MIRKVICLIIPFIVTVITVVIINNFLDNNINEMLEKYELSWASKEYNSVYKDKGGRVFNYFADNDYILLQATSELNVKIPHAPMKFFPIEGMNDVETVGIQGGQSIVHLSVIGSESRKNKNRKVALIVSLQWFYNKDGMTADDFQSTFSPVQFYSFMDNEKISDKNKYRYAVRINDLLKGTSQYSPEKLYAKLYINKSVLSRMVKYIFEPYFLMRKQSVTLKDKGLLYKKLKTLNDKEVTTEFRKIDWDEEYEKSYEEGKESITNNDYMVYDDYYNKYKPDLELHKNYLKDRDILNSKEYDDFQLYLDVCSDMGIKPYIILMPTNGKWYDELGIKKENRDEFYAKLEKISEDNGCEVLNFSDREYEPYFMYDGTHFGWKGWLEVDEQLYKHFQNR